MEGGAGSPLSLCKLPGLILRPGVLQPPGPPGSTLSSPNPLPRWDLARNTPAWLFDPEHRYQGQNPGTQGGVVRTALGAVQPLGRQPRSGAATQAPSFSGLLTKTPGR